MYQYVETEKTGIPSMPVEWFLDNKLPLRYNLYMSWFVYSLLGAILMSAYGISIRLLLRDKGDAKTFTFITTLIGCIALFLLTPFEKITYVFNFQMVVIFLLLSLLFAITDLLLIRGRQLEEVSVVSLLVQLGSIWALFGGYFLLKESLSVQKILGVLFLISGNLLLIYNKQRLFLSKGKLLIVAGTLTFTLSSFVDKLISPSYSPSLYKGILFLFEAIILFLFFLPDRMRSIRKEYKLQGKMLLLVGPMLSFAMFFLIKAFQAGGEASKVLPVYSLSLVFSVIAGIVFLKEKDNLLKKFTAMVLVLVGVYVLQIA